MQSVRCHDPPATIVLDEVARLPGYSTVYAETRKTRKSKPTTTTSECNHKSPAEAPVVCSSALESPATTPSAEQATTTSCTVDEVTRYVAWRNVESCPKCGGADIVKYQDWSGGTTRFVLRCQSVPRSVLSELDALCSGTVENAKPCKSKRSPTTSKSSHPTTAEATEDYVEKVQEILCGYHVSF